LTNSSERRKIKKCECAKVERKKNVDLKEEERKKKKENDNNHM
jgi:hypothetical protein